MKYNWPAVIEEFREILIENVYFKAPSAGKNAKREEDAYHFAFTDRVRNTDFFHPFNTDGELSRALEKIPERVNYYSIKSYWENKRARERLDDALTEMFFELEGTIGDYYSTAWNFAPGYVLPDAIDFGWNFDHSSSAIRRILRAAKKP